MSDQKVRREIALRAAQLMYARESSILSRYAAAFVSPGREPWVSLIHSLSLTDNREP